MLLLLNNGNVLLNQDNRLMSHCNVSVGNGCHNVDSHNNSSVSICNNNDVNLDYERNVSGRTSFVDHDNAHSENFL